MRKWIRNKRLVIIPFLAGLIPVLARELLFELVFGNTATWLQSNLWVVGDFLAWRWSSLLVGIGAAAITAWAMHRFWPANLSEQSNDSAVVTLGSNPANGTSHPRRKILGRGMMQVHISGIPLITVDVYELIQRVADAPTNMGRNLSLIEANKLPLSGPYAEIRDVIQVALDNGFLRLAFNEMAGQSYLLLTERGQSVLDAETESESHSSIVASLARDGNR